MSTTTLVLCSLWAAAAATFSYYCATVAREITYVTLADGRRQERTLPALFRLLLPWASNLTPLLRRPAFAGLRVKTARRLTAAGFEGLLSEDEFLALRLLVPLLVSAVWLPLAHMLLSANQAPFIAKFSTFFHGIGPLWACAYPGMWLGRALRDRHQSIRRALPFVLDVVTLSVEAGLDFMTALQRNVERRKVDALGEELIRVVRNIQLGKTRREALREMSQRVDLPDLRSVVNALVQADELGVSIGAILRIQSDQIRQRRFERAERLANEAPVKMLFPLLFFIFPSVFLVLLGPIIARVAEQGF